MALVVKNQPANAGDYEKRRFEKHGFEKHGLDPWVRKIPWRRAWQPSPVFLAGESPWTERLGGYTPWGRKESDMTEAT